jgi:hypothetical protein
LQKNSNQYITNVEKGLKGHRAKNANVGKYFFSVIINIQINGLAFFFVKVNPPKGGSRNFSAITSC